MPDNNEYKPPVSPAVTPASSSVPPPPPPVVPPISPVAPSPIIPITPPIPQVPPMTTPIATPPNFSARTSSSVPPPPAPDIGIRTMASDLSSLKSTGGLEAKPTTFQPADFTKAPVFNPPKAVSTPGATTNVVLPAHQSRSLLIVAVSAVLVVIAGLVIYFFVWPLIFPAESNTLNPVTTDTTEEQAPPVTNVPAVTPQLTHQTFFIAAPASTSSTVNLATLTLAEIQTALTAAISGAQPQTLTETNLSLNNSPVDATAFMAIAFPELDQAVIGANFDKDMTTFVYKDANGSHPGYIFKLNNLTNLAAVSAAVKGIESSANLPNLFLTSPGAAVGVFKDSITVGDAKARYINYSTVGNSFNYAWFNNYLVVSTSFSGFKEALKLLGLPS